MTTREALITRAHERLMRASSLRLQLAAILTLAAIAAFLISAVSLRLGLGSMAIRYPLAAVCGYLTFLALIRAWIAWIRSVDWARADSRDARRDPVSHVDLPDLSDVARSSSQAPASSAFGGGRSGGAGSGATWADGSSGLRSGGRSAWTGPSIDVDFDEAWPIVIALLCAVGGLALVFYAVYAAPPLLAEVALDAAIISTLYRRMRRQDASHWGVTVLRRTWAPALVVIVLAAIGGYALDQVSPEARSIGAVVRAVRE